VPSFGVAMVISMALAGLSGAATALLRNRLEPFPDNDRQI